MTYTESGAPALKALTDLLTSADASFSADGVAMANQSASIAALTAQRDQALASLAICQGLQNPPPPAPCLFGSNNITRWPKSKVLRQFTPDGSYVQPNAKVDLWQWSNKSAVGSEKSDIGAWATFGVSGEEMAWADKVAKTGQRTHRIKWHEWDAKTRANGGKDPFGVVLAQWQAMQQAGLDYYANHPTITWVVVLTAYSLSIVGEVAKYLGPLRNLKTIGFDFDGSRPTKLPYVDYTSDIAEMRKFKAMGYEVCVPEFGVPSVTADNGSNKSQWLISTAHALATAGATSVALFDSPPEGPLTSLPATAWDSVLNG